MELDIALDDKLVDKFYELFSQQIKWDKAHHNLNSTNFADDDKNIINFISYIRSAKLSKQGITENLSDALNMEFNLEDGKTYREDIKEENDNWFEENSPEDMDKNYDKWIKSHQSHFNPTCIYNMADDIDFYTNPLTHLDIWNILNGNPEKVHVEVWSDMDRVNN